jgi:hypothetical protein
MALIIVAAATATAEALSAAAGRTSFWFGLVDFQSPPAQLGSIQRGNRLVGCSGIGHLDKGEAAGTARFAIRDNADPLHCAMRLKQAAKLWFRGAVG